MPAKTCQYGNCLEDVGEGGITVSLKTPTWDDEKRAIYCCATHASMALLRLAIDRREQIAPMVGKGLESVLPELNPIPRRWRVT